MYLVIIIVKSLVFKFKKRVNIQENTCDFLFRYHFAATVSSYMATIKLLKIVLPFSQLPIESTGLVMRQNSYKTYKKDILRFLDIATANKLYFILLVRSRWNRNHNWNYLVFFLNTDGIEATLN